MRLAAAMLIPLLALQCACAGPRAFGGSPGLTVLPDTQLPMPAASSGTNALAYTVRPLDKLRIDVFEIRELSDVTIQVDPSGRITFPFVGEIDVNNQTLEQITEGIEDRLRGRYVRNPQVSVNIVEPAGNVLSIEGQVREPGNYQVVADMTLLRAIASARGTTEFADSKDVVVFRTVSGARYASLVNLDAIRRGAYPDPKVIAGDIIVVGDSPGRRLFRDILTAAPLAITPIVALLQNSN